MNPRSAIGYALALSVVAIAASSGCNGLLGNEEGTPRLDAGIPGDEPCDTTKGNKVCFGLCVSIADPKTGCGGACGACDLKNAASATCVGDAEAGALVCSYDQCNAGFGDCNGDKADGCEQTLDTRGHCGSCGTRCADPSKPFCVVSGGRGDCVAEGACPAGRTACATSGSCVDTTTSVENCGGCDKACSRASADASCVGGACVFTCQSGTHECGQRCVQDTDPTACGTACVPCPQLEAFHADAICRDGACAAKCATGYNNCDGKTINGCEHAGPCPCGSTEDCEGTQLCCAGVCTAPVGGFGCPTPVQ